MKGGTLVVAGPGRNESCNIVPPWERSSCLQKLRDQGTRTKELQPH